MRDNACRLVRAGRDPAHDLFGSLTTFDGDTSDHSDLDVVLANATRRTDSVFLISAQDGAIGLTQDGIYVWGVDRGSGVDFLRDFDPSLGEGVKFDTFIIVKPNGTA